MHLNKKLIGWVVVVVIAGVAIHTLLKSTPEDSSLAGTPSVGTDLLDLLNKLKDVNFETNLFANPNFSSLVDWSIPLPTPSVGRPNPFERIGLDVGVISSAPVTPASTTTSP